MSTLSTSWRPARIIGEVPSWYDGPVYYRARGTAISKIQYFSNFVRLQPRRINGIQLRERLPCVDSLFKARWQYPDMCNENGELLPEWREPAHVKRKANFPKKWDHLDPGSLRWVSERFKNGVEGLEPDRHFFRPVVFEPADGDPGPLFLFWTGQGGFGYCALSTRFNPTMKYFAPVPAKHTDEFMILDRNLVHDWHWFECEVGSVVSKDLLSVLGDILPPTAHFVPMGVE